jgi:hypothetical protein
MEALGGAADGMFGQASGGDGGEVSEREEQLGFGPHRPPTARDRPVPLVDDPEDDHLQVEIHLT